MKRHITEILFYWLIISLIVPNAILSFTESMPLLARITNVVLPLGVIGLFASISRQIGKATLFMIPLMIIGAFQIVLLFLYGSGIISVDMFLNLVTTNYDEASELLARLWPALTVEAIIYVTPLVAAGYCIYKRYFLENHFLKCNRKVFTAVTVVGLITLGCCYWQNSGYDVRADLYPVNVRYNLHLSGRRFNQTRSYFNTSADYDYEAHSAHGKQDKETYIIVIGETSRAHNWEILGYDRATNPFLSKRSDLLVAKNAYSESNTTHKSVPMLLSCVDARSFDNELWRVKSLISAFKECGFHTAFISNQLPNHSYIDFFGNEADTTLFVKLLPNNEYTLTDEKLVGYVEDFLKTDYNKQLVVVHTYGSHFNYRGRYNDQDRKFMPDDFYEASKVCRKKLINAYDNSIVATDHLLDDLIKCLGRQGGMGGLLYTSDHGEDIYDDDGSKFLHASPVPTEYQLHVPLLVWLSPEYMESNPEIVETLKENCGKTISTSRSFCPTALAVGGIMTNKSDSTDNLASERYQPKDLYYLNDHNKPLPFKIKNDQLDINGE